MSSSARIDELRKKFDENPRRYFAPLANEYRKVGDFDQAIFICQEYLPQQPGHMSGHIVFGQALFEAKRLPEARTVFETALTLDPENLIALRHLADISRDLGETTVARGWYERVLQADPRNEEIAAIMNSMPAAGSPTATTSETPVPSPASAAAPPAPPAAKAAPASPAAPTMELSAAAVQEMVRARHAAQNQEAPAPDKLTLDESPTVEVNAAHGSSTLEGFETTSHEGLLDMPSGGMLGLEPTAAPSQSSDAAAPAATPEGLDKLTLDDFSVPSTGAAPAAATAPATSTAAGSEPAGGLLDFDSFELGGEAPPATPEPVAQSLVAPAMDFAMPAAQSSAAAPIDVGHEPIADFDFEVPATPSAPPSPQESIPTMVMDAIEDTIPAVMDIVEDAVPAVVDAVVSAPTMIMDAIRTGPPKAEEPPVAAKEPSKVPKESETVAPTQQMDVASVMGHIDAARKGKSQPEAPADRQAASFVTETMAQLYLEQGHRAAAIEIYRQLVAARPGDAELRGRLDAIERGGGSRAPQTMEVPAASPASPVSPRPSEPAPAPTIGRFAASGPSIRTVLRELFGIDAQSTNGSGGANGGGEGEIGSIDILFSAESVPEELGPLASAFDGGYVAPSGSIDAVFVTDSR
jgi:tetratricopeptide (TPR) repeat protein